MPNNPFLLYQHTPLIHFQAEQAGATLRASEVKPRLDRWLKKKNGWTKENTPELFTLSDEENQSALNYRMRIVAREEDRVNSVHEKAAQKTFAGFFADQGIKDYSRLRKVTMHSKVLLTITTPIPALEKYLTEEALAPFFMSHNFGTRSSKGFGAFTPAVPLNDAEKMGWVAKFHVGLPEDYGHLFRRIQFVNRALRGGLNRFRDPVTGSGVSGPYMKPLLFKYAMDSGLEWEKRVFKSQPGVEYNGFDRRKRQKINIHQIDEEDTKATKAIRAKWPKDGFEDAPERSEDKWPLWYQGQNQKDQQKHRRATVRDALGLSTDQSWMNWSINPVKKEDKTGRVKRAPSAITFVPVRMSNGFAVYLYARQPEKLFLEDTTITAQLGKNKQNTIELPVFPGFSMHDFLKVYCNRSTVEKCTLDPSGDDALRRNELLDIFDQISRSLQLNNIQSAEEHQPKISSENA